MEARRRCTEYNIEFYSDLVLCLLIIIRPSCQQPKIAPAAAPVEPTQKIAVSPATGISYHCGDDDDDAVADNVVSRASLFERPVHKKESTLRYSVNLQPVTILF